MCRLDCDAAGLKQKTVLDVISLCLGNKEDFRSDVIREALSDLLLDDIPAQALMRTAILSAQVSEFIAFCDMPASPPLFQRLSFFSI